MHWLNLQVAKKKARHLAAYYDLFSDDYTYTGSHYEKILRRTRVPCSCAMCGNPRHHFSGIDGLTRKDKIQADIEREQMGMIYERLKGGVNGPAE